LPRDLFEKDQESEQAQIEQHKLLETLLPEAGLYNYFKKHKQEEPLILTNLGIVVNGNRRLCAMRDLLESDTSKFRHFRNIQVVFLPPADERDIDELEASLQIRPDIKAEFSWIARACMMKRRQVDHQYDTEALAALYGLKPQQVREQLEMRDLADSYLDSIGTPKKYDAVLGDEFAFKALRAELRRVYDPADKLLVQQLAFHLMQTDPEGTGRLHTFIPKVVQHRAVIVDRLAKEFGEPPIVEEPERPKTSKKESGDEALLGQAVPQFEINPKLREPERADAINAIIVDVVEGEQAKARQKRWENSVVSSLDLAYSSLYNANLALSSSTFKPEVKLRLASVDEALGEFKKKLKKYDHD
jgi:hypothetical protein